MGKALKIPGFIVKLIDAFILRIPVAFIITALLFQLNGVDNAASDALKASYIIYTFVLPFAFGWGLLYVLTGCQYSSGGSSWAKIGRGFLTVVVIGIIVKNSIEQDGIVPYLKNLKLGAKLIMAWIVYAYCSEFVKGAIAKKNKLSKKDGTKKLDRVMSEVQAVSNAFVNMDISDGQKVFSERISGSEPKAKKEPKVKQELKPSGAVTEKDFFASLKKNGYSTIFLDGDMAIVFSGKSGYVLKFIRDKAQYTCENGTWLKDGVAYGDVNTEVNTICNQLRSKCSMVWTRGLVIKTFAGGKVPASHHLKYADVSQNYNDAEEAVINHVAPGKNDTAQTEEKIRKVFANRLVKEGGNK